MSLSREKQLQRKCDSWNRRFPVGTKVVVRKDDGELVDTLTRSEAHVLSGTKPVVLLEGIAGTFLLECVDPFVWRR